MIRVHSRPFAVNHSQQTPITMDTPLTASQALPPGTRLEEFAIEKVLGAGGFGITYLARDISLGRQVVIKENLPSQFVWRETATGTVRPRHSSGGDSDDFEWSMRNFLREAETLASLDHPGIVRVLRKFETNGTAYFVMPFVQGIAFDQLITVRQQKNQPFTEEELRGLLERMLDALGYLHDRGIYHRDIKPGNILISNQGVPALIDFGSARQRLSERSMTVIESAGYTPFEQHQSRGNVGPWSDLYALAATLVKAITFETLPKAADRVLGDPWPGLVANSRIAGHYSSQFLSSIEKALAPLPEHRWQDAREWQDNLQTGIPMVGIAENTLPRPPVSNAATSNSRDPATMESARVYVGNLSYDVNELDLQELFKCIGGVRNVEIVYNSSTHRSKGYGFVEMLHEDEAVRAVEILHDQPFMGRNMIVSCTNGKQQELDEIEEAGPGIKTATWKAGDPATEKISDAASLPVAPALWNPTAAVNLSVLLTPALGTFLHARNAKALGIPNGQEIGMRWFYLMCAYIVLGTLLGLPGKYFFMINVVMLILWYFVSAIKQIRLVKERYGKDYPRKSVVTPVFTCIFFAFAISILLELMQARARNEIINSLPDESNSTESATTSSEQNAEDLAISYFNRGVEFANCDGVPQNREEAVKWYRKAAEMGNLSAMNNLGAGYEDGHGVPKDIEESIKWYRKAAELGLALSQRNLAYAYLSGEGVSKNIETAIGWYKKAAMQGDADAQYVLGLAYTGGDGIAEDLVESAKWIQKAADQGHAEAQKAIAYCYVNGKGVSKDAAKAFEWTYKSALNSNLDAQFQLGLMYSSGTGVAADHGEAAKWFHKTAEGGEARGMANLGWCYENGKGVTMDEAEAVKWYRKAAEAGDEQVALLATEALQRIAE
jgi:TPR repeat protein/serine/threonine protein kinase